MSITPPPTAPAFAFWTAGADLGRNTLLEWSRERPVLLVFLRHFGCTFCREALADLEARRSEIERRGWRIALVHMVSNEEAAGHLAKLKLGAFDAISDPGKTLYAAFGLGKGSLTQLFGPKVWARGLRAGLVGGHGIGGLAGDALQMPGAFVLADGEVAWAFRHRSAADRPEYLECDAGCSLDGR